MSYLIQPQNGAILNEEIDSIHSVLSGEKAIYSFEAVVPEWLFIWERNKI